MLKVTRHFSPSSAAGPCGNKHRPELRASRAGKKTRGSHPISNDSAPLRSALKVSQLSKSMYAPPGLYLVALRGSTTSSLLPPTPTLVRTVITEPFLMAMWWFVNAVVVVDGVVLLVVLLLAAGACGGHTVSAWDETKDESVSMASARTALSWAIQRYSSESSLYPEVHSRSRLNGSFCPEKCCS